jgi:hypothetical protein
MPYAWNLCSAPILFDQIYSNLASCICALHSTFCIISQIFGALYPLRPTFMKSIPGASSQCSLKENPKFLQNFKTKNCTLKGNFWLIFSFNIYNCIPGPTFKSKNYCFISQNYVHYISENFQNLRPKRKLALWMRHLIHYLISCSRLCPKH